MLLQGPGGAEWGQVTLPSVHSHNSLPQSGVILSPRTDFVCLAYKFPLQKNPAVWYLQQLIPGVTGQAVNANRSVADTRG